MPSYRSRNECHILKEALLSHYQTLLQLQLDHVQSIVTRERHHTAKRLHFHTTSHNFNYGWILFNYVQSNYKCLGILHIGFKKFSFYPKFLLALVNMIKTKEHIQMTNLKHAQLAQKLLINKQLSRLQISQSSFICLVVHNLLLHVCGPATTKTCTCHQEPRLRLYYASCKDQTLFVGSIPTGHALTNQCFLGPEVAKWTRGIGNLPLKQK